MNLSIIYTSIIINSRMLGRQERVALLLLLGVAVTVIAVHSVLTVLGKQPLAHPLTNTSAEGELVFLEGMVDKVVLTKNGGHVIVSIKNQTVFIPAQVAQGHVFQNGQNLSLYGIVETYRGEKEVVVNSAEDIRYR
jgi:hypothetical protein